MMIKTRFAQQGDLDELSALAAECGGEYAQPGGDEAVVAVADAKGRLAGCCRADIADGGSELTLLYVREEFRFKGLEARMLNCVLEELNARSIAYPKPGAALSDSARELLLKTKG